MIIPKDAVIVEVAATMDQRGWKKGEKARIAGWPFILEGLEDVKFLIDERMLVYADSFDEMEKSSFIAEGITKWYITELSTGMLAAVGDSRSEAESVIHNQLAKVGRQGFLDAIERGKKILKECEIEATR